MPTAAKSFRERFPPKDGKIGERSAFRNGIISHQSVAPFWRNFAMINNTNARVIKPEKITINSTVAINKIDGNVRAIFLQRDARGVYNDEDGALFPKTR